MMKKPVATKAPVEQAAKDIRRSGFLRGALTENVQRTFGAIKVAVISACGKGIFQSGFQPLSTHVLKSIQRAILQTVANDAPDC